MTVKVGRPIVVGDVIFRSARILIDRPFLMIPQLIVLIPALVVDLLTSSSPFNPLGLIIGILSGVLSVIVTGAYPPLVKAALEGGQHSVTEALGKAYHRFWTLLGAGIDRKSTRLNSSHTVISYAVFCLKKKKSIKTKVYIATRTEPRQDSTNTGHKA